MKFSFVFSLVLSIFLGDIYAEELGFGRDTYSYYRSARGFLIEELQIKLGIDPETKRLSSSTDREEVIFGKRTESAVKAAQKEFGLQETGIAGPSLYERLELEWPIGFLRAAQLTSSSGFEGTSFGSSVGPARTYTQDGVTYGISGFTSFNGELQRLLRNFLSENEEVSNRLITQHLTDEEQTQFHKTIASDAGNRDFEKWGLTVEDNVQPNLKKLLSDFGSLPEMQTLQLEKCRAKWDRALAIGRELCGDKMTLRTKALFYDIYTYSNGPTGKGKPIPNTDPQEHERFDGLQKLKDMPWSGIREREEQIIDMTIERLTHKWGPDHPHVKRPKVRWYHFRDLKGDEANLKAFAIQPRD